MISGVITTAKNTVSGNLLEIEIEKQFLEHFRRKALGGDSVGTGKLIEYGVRFAVYTGDGGVANGDSQVVCVGRGYER